MTASDFDYQSNRNDIIRRAYKICGALAKGDQLDGNDYDDANKILNDMIKSWQGNHIFLWTLYRTSLTTVIGTATYNLPTDPPIFGIDNAYLTENGDDLRVAVISWDQYCEIPRKAVPGKPEVIAVNFDQASGLFKAYVWPVPTTVWTMPYTGIARLKDFDAATSNGDFKPEWTNALVYGVAEGLSDELTLPLAERSYITQKARDYLKDAKKGDRQVSQSDFVDKSPWG